MKDGKIIFIISFVGLIFTVFLTFRSKYYYSPLLNGSILSTIFIMIMIGSYSSRKKKKKKK